MMYKLQASLLMLCFGFQTVADTQPSTNNSNPQAALTVLHPEQTLLSDIVNTGAGLVAVGKHGTIIKSVDGQKWQQGSVPVQSLLTAVHFTTPNQGWACGHDATILHTEDGGLNWQIQQYLPQLDKPCLDISFKDALNGIAIGAYGMYFETNDGGKSWQKRFLEEMLLDEDREYLAELKDSDPQTYEQETAFMLPHFNRIAIKDNVWVIVGEMGLVAVSQNDGYSWTRLNEFYRGSLFDVSITPSNEVLVAGLRGNAFRSNLDDLMLDNWQKLAIDKTATINSIVASEGKHLLVANSGVIFVIDNGNVTTVTFKNGKSILSAVPFNNKLILATESGVTSVENNY